MKRNLLQQAATLKAIDVSALAGTTAKVGEVIDTMGYESAILSINYAKTTSDPSVATVTLTMAEGATSSPVTAVTLSTTPSVINAQAAGGISVLNIDLRGLARYIRFTVTPAYTGGTSPNIYCGGTITLGDRNMNPTPDTVATIYRKA